MLTKINVTVLCLISIPFAFVLGAFVQNHLPWTKSPGVMARVRHYLTTNIAETTQDSPYPELRTREYDYPTDQLFSLLEASVAELGWQIDGQRNDQTYSLHAVVTTALLGYQDDVLIRLVPIATNKNQLYVRSSSRKGQGDLGTNTRHILDLYNQIERLVGK